jgi:epoxyqueuosine reductase
MLTSQQVKDKARDLGFDLCGIAPVDSFPELGFLKEWLDKGYAGEMAWMARSADARADVRNIHPGARSVIVLGTLYNSVPPDKPQSLEPKAQSRAAISRYAWGDDYHGVLKQRVAALAAWMHETGDEPFSASIYVDTGPVQERVYAQYAGLGWIGKNTCLINPELGSYLFLAEIICTLPLEADTQGLEQCGTCRQCLDACPTGALVDAGVLDATKCLSYLTIELRGAIPEAQRPALGSHIYGCDICQEVCPYNQLPPRSADAAWQPRAPLDLPKLVEMWRRPDRELRDAVKGSAMTRTRLTGLRRNLAVAIGNSGDTAAIAALAEASDERPSAEDEMVLEHIRWAVTRSTI